MIRINLLPSEARRRRRGGQSTLTIVMLLAIVELLGLFTWYQGIEEESLRQATAVRKAEESVKRLEKAKNRLEEREEEKGELARQNGVLEKLKTDKTGPATMLKFISYVLTRKEDNLYNREELTAQEAAGWASGWDPQNVWITKLTEEFGEVTLIGLARSHEDVAEFYRRMETSIHFVGIDPVMQEVVNGQDFDELELVAFEAYTLVNYDPEGKLRMKRENVPEQLTPFIVASAEPPKEDEGKKKKKKSGGH
jgi:Tfp pilus assembly protein PilN